MVIKDGCVWFKTREKQLAFSTGVGMLAALCLLLSSTFEVVESFAIKYVVIAAKAVSLFVMLYALGYSLLLTNIMLRKHYGS